MAGDKGVHTFSVTLKTTGNQTITVSDVANYSVSGTATVSVIPPAVYTVTNTLDSGPGYCAR